MTDHDLDCEALNPTSPAPGVGEVIVLLRRHAGSHGPIEKAAALLQSQAAEIERLNQDITTLLQAQKRPVAEDRNEVDAHRERLHQQDLEAAEARAEKAESFVAAAQATIAQLMQERDVAEEDGGKWQTLAGAEAMRADETEARAKRAEEALAKSEAYHTTTAKLSSELYADTRVERDRAQAEVAALKAALKQISRKDTVPGKWPDTQLSGPFAEIAPAALAEVAK